jgi:nucleoid DNA-binding protein
MGLNKKKLAKEVRDVLGLCEVHPFSKDLAFQVVTKVIETIVKALQAGETVTIHGIGKFYIRRLPPRKQASHVLGHYRGHGTVQLPARSIVKFLPSRPLIKELNGSDRSADPD